MGATEETAARITRVWRNDAGEPYAAGMTSAEGGRFTAGLSRGQVSWAEPDVWAFPERHGLHRYYCPGHGGGVCQYGMCDETRVTDLERLRGAASSHVVTSREAYEYGGTDGRAAAVLRYGPESCRPARAVPERHAAVYRNGWEHAYRAARRAS